MKDENKTINSAGKGAHSFLKGTVILTISGIVVKVIGSLNWIILSRVLGGEGIGLYQMGFPIYLLALSVSSAGIPVAISIMTAEKLAFRDYRGANRVFSLSLTMLFGTGLLFSLLLFFGAEWLIQNRFIRDARAYYSIIALAPAVFFVTLLASFRGYLQGWQIMTPTAVSEIVEQLFRVITMIIFASLLMPKGLAYAAGGASLGAGAGAIAGLGVLIAFYLRLQRKFQGYLHDQNDLIIQESSSSILKRLIRLALPVSMSSLMLPFVANLDLLIVPARLEVAGFKVAQATELFGYLTGMAVPLVNLSTILTAALSISLVPSISESYSLQDKSQIYQKTATAIRIAATITIPSAVGLYLLAKPVATAIYNAPAATIAIKALSPAIFLLGLHQVTTGILQGMGRTTIPVINMLVAAGVKVFLNWTLTANPMLGIQGAALATVADIGVAAILNLYFIYHHVGFSIRLTDLMKPALASIAMGIAVFTSYFAFVGYLKSDALATLVAILVAIPVYAGVLLSIGGINAQDLDKVPYVGSRMADGLRRIGLIK